MSTKKQQAEDTIKVGSKASLNSYRVRIPKGRTGYYLIFRPKGAKSDKWITLDTDNKTEALKRAKLKFEAFHEERHDALQATAGTNTFARIGDVLDRYKATTTVKRPRHAIGSLLSIIRTVFHCSENAAREMRADILTGELINKYRMEVRAAAKADGKPLNIISTNARIVAARSIFTDPETMFPDMKLPDLRSFREAKGEKGATAEAGFRPLPDGTIERMEAAADALRESMPDLWLSVMMFRHFGLRPIEALSARGGWFERIDGALHLAIRNRPAEGFIIKNAIEHFIEVPAKLVPVFESIPANDFVICPRASKTQRDRFINRTVCTWVRTFIPDRTKSTYELRKHAGSEIYMRDGIEAAKYFLGHTNIETTQKWYAAWLRRVKAAGDDDATKGVDPVALEAAARKLVEVLNGPHTAEQLRAAKEAVETALATKTEKVVRFDDKNAAEAAA